MGSVVRIRIIAAFICLLALSDAFAACNGSQNLPSVQMHVAFGFGKSKVDGFGREKLGRWINSMKSKYAIHKWVTIIGSASDAEDNPSGLAMRRAIEVAKIAMDDGLVNSPLDIKVEVYSVRDRSNVIQDSHEVTVQLSPGCPNDCCDIK